MGRIKLSLLVCCPLVQVEKSYSHSSLASVFNIRFVRAVFTFLIFFMFERHKTDQKEIT